MIKPLENTAYQILSDDSKNSEGRAEVYCNLPQVTCGECGSGWFTSRVWYPTVRKTNDVTRRLYSDERTVSVNELNRLRAGLKPMHKAKRMPPGAGIGPIQAQLSSYATDFVWCACLLLAAKPVIRKFRQEGIILPHGPVIVYLGGTRSEAYVALELELHSICSQETEKALGIGRCLKCGAVRRLRGFDNQVIDNLKYEYRVSEVPKDHGLVLEDIDEMILAARSFINVYRKNQMTGLNFRQAGVWI